MKPATPSDQAAASPSFKRLRQTHRLSLTVGVAVFAQMASASAQTVAEPPAAPSVAPGANAPAPSADAVPRLESVTVTGSKRDTRFLDSDLSATVIDRQAAQEARIRDIRRIDDLVPNVQFNQSSQLGGTFVTIRGVESNPYIVNRAAVYIDGIPFRDLSNAVLNHIDGIEVLRGPQSTLYGANSEAGLILVRSRAPRDKLEGEAQLTHTRFGNGTGLEASAFLGGPLVPQQLSAALSVLTSREDAYIRNIGSSIGEPGRLREGFVQGRLRWTPNDTLTVNLLGYHLRKNAPGLFDQEFIPLDTKLYDGTYGSTYNNGRTSGRFDFINDAPKGTRDSESVVGISATQDLAYGTLDAALSYRRERSDSRGIDLDLTALPTAAGRDLKVETVHNAELRFASPESKRFQWLAGVTLYEQRNRVTLGTLVGPGGLDDFKLAPDQTSTAKDWALFGSATWGLPLDGLSFTAGLRYDRAERSTWQQAGQLDLGPAGVLTYREMALKNTFSDVLPRLALSYRVNPDLLLFTSAAKGYIPGGFNLAAAQQQVADEVIRYNKESLWSYEVGFKRSFDAKRGYVSGAVFFVESKNWQEVQVLTDSQGRVISSAFIGARAGLRSQGFELESSWEPAKGLQLTGSVGFTDAKYTNFRIAGTEELRGKRVKLVPRYDANLALRYRHGSGWFTRGELSATGAIPLNERGTAVQKAVALVNLQAGYEASTWSARAFVENAGNKRVASGLAFENFAFGRDGNFYAPLDSPRIAGLEVSLKF
jgi:iron complex outermembrane receptor protein